MSVLRWFNITKVALAVLIQIYSGCAVPTDDHPPAAICYQNHKEAPDKSLDPASGYLRVRYERLPYYCRRQRIELPNMAPFVNQVTL